MIRSLPALYLLYALPVLAGLAILTPPWQAPDEPLHMARAVQIARGGLIARRLWSTAGGVSDPAIYDSFKPVQPAAMHPQTRLGAGEVARAGAVPWSTAPAQAAFPNTAQYPPLFYIPDACAYWLGRAAGLSILRTLILARLANAAIFALATASALAMARRTRPLLAAILLLPTTLFLAASASQDWGIFASAALLVALIDRSAGESRDAPPPQYAIALAAILIACLGAARPPYACFLLLLFCGQAGFSRRRLLLASLAASAILAWCVIVALGVSVPLGGADPAAQWHFLAGHPAAIPRIIAATARAHAWTIWREIIGVLGWTDTILPRPYLLLQSGVLILAALASGQSLAPRCRAIILASAALSTGAIFVLQWLFWTWPGQGIITGVLGRYFIPIAMLLGPVIPGRPGPFLRRAAWTAIGVTAALTPAVTFFTMRTRYGL